MPAAWFANGVTWRKVKRSTSIATKMEETDHETSRNIDVEGPSTPVNVYGSPVAPRGRGNEESIVSTSHVVPLPLAIVNRVVSSILHFLRDSTRPEILSWNSSIYNSKYFLLSQTCSCKNSCSRKKTAKTPGCPCQNASIKCSSSFTCGTKRTACKNKTVEVVVNRNPSAFSRHQEQAATAQREIQVSLVLRYVSTPSLPSVVTFPNKAFTHSL